MYLSLAKYSVIILGAFLIGRNSVDEKICPQIQINENTQIDQSHKEKSTDTYIEEIIQMDGTKIKRSGVKELSVDDYLKSVKSTNITIQIPPPEPDNFSVDIDTKNIQSFPKLDLKSVAVGVRATDHWWAYYRRDIEHSENIVGVRYTTRVCLWHCP
jgi:hypothetical protein